MKIINDNVFHFLPGITIKILKRIKRIKSYLK